ncbi:hypothetical protein, conserved [Plasmodium gonderi]|uniref:RNA-editing substrate-binding complex 6 protein domain-containing protein n=1 Tax=Plasmodium gonderi TaxID=77519 RepID=A0A1Y1JMK3_PLAGO|nr:hypothetical protein, conserved [Plasmodium gonderi]GAW81264.1 hypothetical protein, conserved [Plasmodium gonderi]
MKGSSFLLNHLKCKLLNRCKNEKKHLLYSTVTKRFGELHQPRTRSEKKSHLEIIDEVYFDMTDAMREKNKLEIEEYSSIHRNISEIILNHNISKKNEIIKNIMRYCIEFNRKNKMHEQKRKRENVNEVNKMDEEKEIFNIIKCNIKEYCNQFNSCEIGIILKCLLKIKVNDLSLINVLLQHYFKRNMKFSQYGSLYILYAFTKLNLLPQHENNFKLLCSDILNKINNFEFKNLCLVCNYLSALYNFNKTSIRYMVEQICTFLMNESKNNDDTDTDSIWCEDSIHYIANACARVNHLNKELFHFLKKKIEKRTMFFSIDQLVSLTNAYSKFKSAEEENFLSLYLLIADEIINKSYLLKPRHLSVLANSFNNACILHEKLFHIITENSLLLLSSFEPKQIVMIIHAYVNIGLSNNALLESIWNTASVFIPEYTLQELSMLLQAYTKSSQHRQKFFNQVSLRIYSLITISYPFLEENATANSIMYNHEKYVKMLQSVKTDDYLTSEKITTEQLFSLFYLVHNHQYYYNFMDHLLTISNNKYNNLPHPEIHNEIQNSQNTPNKIPINDEKNPNKYTNGFKQSELHEKHDIDNSLSKSIPSEELPDMNNVSVCYNEKITPTNKLIADKKIIQKSISENYTNYHDMDEEPFSHLCIRNQRISKKKFYSNETKINYLNSSDIYYPDTEKMEQRLIKHMSKDINATLVCSIIYSLIKGNCLLQYDLLICLSKLAIIFLKKFKISELANVCSALSEAYIRASDENNRQNELITKRQNKKFEDQEKNAKEDKQKEEKGREKEQQNELKNEHRMENKVTSFLCKHQTIKKITSPNNTPTYDEQLYNSSKLYLSTCTLFFDNVEYYLMEKKNFFTDVHSTYKFITSFGTLRMSKYSSVALHLFRLSLLEIKHLSYLPLQKMANAFMQMNVYNEDVYAFINKIQKTKKNK